MGFCELLCVPRRLLAASVCSWEMDRVMVAVLGVAAGIAVRSVSTVLALSEHSLGKHQAQTALWALVSLPENGASRSRLVFPDAQFSVSQCAPCTRTSFAEAKALGGWWTTDKRTDSSPSAPGRCWETLTLCSHVLSGSQTCSPKAVSMACSSHEDLHRPCDKMLTLQKREQRPRGLPPATQLVHGTFRTRTRSLIPGESLSMTADDFPAVILSPSLVGTCK